MFSAEKVKPSLHSYNLHFEVLDLKVINLINLQNPFGILELFFITFFFFILLPIIASV